MPLNIGDTRTYRDLWFRLAPEDAGPAMVQTAKAIEAAQNPRNHEILKYAMAYANRSLSSYADLATSADSQSIAPWSLISAVVSNGSSMITRSAVRLIVETSGGDTKLRRDASEATRWLNGVFAANRVDSEIAPTVHIDAGVTNLGLAVVRVEEKKGKKSLRIERVLPDEIIVSDQEALHGRPFQGFIKRLYDKHVAMALWGGDDLEKQAAIEKSAPTVVSSAVGGYRADQVEIYEGWAIDGAHVVAVEGMMLAYEKWKHSFLPWAPMYIERPLAGFYGRGWGAMLFGYQVSLWELNDSIEECIRLCASPKWMNPIGSNTPPEALSNEHGGIVPHAPGHAPSLVTFPAVPRDLLDERGRLWNQGLADVGMSDWGLAGELPGKMSGTALDNLRERDHGRISTPAGEYEQFHVRLGTICLEMGPEVNDWKVTGREPGSKDLKQVNFSRIADLIRTAPWTVAPPKPIAALPQSPAGRRQAVEKWVELSLMTPLEGRMALDLNDNDTEEGLLVALREEVLTQIDDILADGEKGYRPPEKILIQMGGQMPAQLAGKAYLQARRQGVDEEKLDSLLQWVNECEALFQQLQQPPPAQLAPEKVVVGANAGTTFAPEAAPIGAAPAESTPPEMALPQLPPA